MKNVILSMALLGLIACGSEEQKGFGVPSNYKLLKIEKGDEGTRYYMQPNPAVDSIDTYVFTNNTDSTYYYESVTFPAFYEYPKVQLPRDLRLISTDPKKPTILYAYWDKNKGHVDIDTSMAAILKKSRQ